VKAYVLTTGLVFALILAAHIARLFAEGFQLLRQPTFLTTSLLSIGLAWWAIALVWRGRRESAQPSAGMTRTKPRE
jgi:hypothetical protein